PPHTTPAGAAPSRSSAAPSATADSSDPCTAGSTSSSGSTTGGTGAHHPSCQVELGARPTSAPVVTRILGGGDQVAGGAGVDLDAGTHRGGDGDALDVAALGRGRLGPEDLVQDDLVVLDQGPGLERGLAQDQVQVAVAVDPVLDLAALDIGD